MKIRCKNCYKVLKPNEEYCTSCGEHSAQIAECIKTGDYGPQPVDKFKTAFILFLILGFLGNGVIMTILAVNSNNATSTLYNKSNALFFSSILTFIVLAIVCKKSFQDYLWNKSYKNFMSTLVIAIFVGAISILLSKIFSFTKILPDYAVTYLQSGEASFIKGKETNILFLLISFLLVAFNEELIFRRLLIDALDDATLLSDQAIIIVATIVGTLLDFSIVMCKETVLVTLMINYVCSSFYAHTNRSVGMNLLLRFALIFIVVFMNLN